MSDGPSYGAPVALQNLSRDRDAFGAPLSVYVWLCMNLLDVGDWRPAKVAGVARAMERPEATVRRAIDFLIRRGYLHARRTASGLLLLRLFWTPPPLGDGERQVEELPELTRRLLNDAGEVFHVAAHTGRWGVAHDDGSYSVLDLHDAAAVGVGARIEGDFREGGVVFRDAATLTRYWGHVCGHRVRRDIAMTLLG